MSVFDLQVSGGAWSQFQTQDLAQPSHTYQRLVHAMGGGQGVGQGGLAYLATQLVGLTRGLSQDETIATFLMVLCLLEAHQGGSTRLSITSGSLEGLRKRIETTIGEANELFDIDSAQIAQTMIQLWDSSATQSLIGLRPGAHPLIRRNGWLHESSLLSRELALAENLLKLHAQSVGGPQSTSSVPALESPLTEEQQAAVIQALNNPLTLVTGGPGTGKTSIIVAIIQAFLADGLSADSMVLCAPTGKAAWRMDQAIRQGAETTQKAAMTLEPAGTLHRTLGYGPRTGRFQRHRRNPIDARVIIVDEASMIDTMLMERLTNAIGTGSRLVLLGDCDQLPSVGAGQVYQDMINAFPEATVRLTHSFRMRADDPAGSQILAFAQEIRCGSIRPESIRECASVADLSWRGVERFTVDADVTEVCACWYQQFYADQVRKTLSAFEHLPDVANDADILTEHLGIFETAQALAVTRKGPNGVDAANSHLHQIHAQEHDLNARTPFLPGSPVIMRRNDYARSLFNGDQGLVIGPKYGPTDSLAVLFRGLDGPRIFPLHGLMGDLDLAYVLTVHQSQGSEYGNVMLLLPTVDVSILTRQLVYTAITRSRRGVTLFGPLSTLQMASSRSAERDSTLPELLKVSNPTNSPSGIGGLP